FWRKLPMPDRSSLAADFKAADASSYDAVSPSFDSFSTRLSGPLARRLLALARVGPGEQVLDVGTGTGLVALAAAELVSPGGGVLGIDLSEGMLSRAQRKARQAGLTSHLSFQRMDAETLELEGASRDAVVSLFALAHFPDPLTALREAFGVLRPGGWV